MIVPVSGRVVILPYLHSEALAADIKKRSGLLYQPHHDKKSGFEGVPNQGYVRVLPEDYTGDLKPGDHIVFNENSPKGFHDEEGNIIFIIGLDQIIAKVEE